MRSFALFFTVLVSAIAVNGTPCLGPTDSIDEYIEFLSYRVPCNYEIDRILDLLYEEFVKAYNDAWCEFETWKVTDDCPFIGEYQLRYKEFECKVNKLKKAYDEIRRQIIQQAQQAQLLFGSNNYRTSVAQLLNPYQNQLKSIIDELIDCSKDCRRFYRKYNSPSSTRNLGLPSTGSPFDFCGYQFPCDISIEDVFDQFYGQLRPNFDLYENFNKWSLTPQGCDYYDDYVNYRTDLQDYINRLNNKYEIVKREIIRQANANGYRPGCPGYYDNIQQLLRQYERELFDIINGLNPLYQQCYDFYNLHNSPSIRSLGLPSNGLVVPSSGSPFDFCGYQFPCDISIEDVFDQFYGQLRPNFDLYENFNKWSLTPQGCDYYDDYVNYRTDLQDYINRLNNKYEIVKREIIRQANANGYRPGCPGYYDNIQQLLRQYERELFDIINGLNPLYQQCYDFYNRYYSVNGYEYASSFSEESYYSETVVEESLFTSGLSSGILAY